MSANEIKIAIVDSGIDKETCFKAKDISANINFVGENSFDTFGHGTMCYKIMKDYIISQNTKFFVLKVFAYNGQTKSKYLLEAIEALLGIDVQIINLSLSFTHIENSNIFEKISKVCSLLQKQNKIIICSLRNGMDDMKVTFPAGLKSVIGVRGAFLKSSQTFWFNTSYRLQAVANIEPELIDLGDNKLRFFSGNSKSAALLSAIVTNHLFLINEKLGMHDCLALLESKAERTFWEEEDIRKTFRLFDLQNEQVITNELNTELSKKANEIICNLGIDGENWQIDAINEVLDNLQLISSEIDYKKLKYTDFNCKASFCKAISAQYNEL